ncbi:MAG: UDP-N-acetylmuramate dehydrogenase [Spirochaetaceae bacterium]|nr:MAG: UDP-N-acetylmuramate dehydrogenase [Spirochaetaceae bacterium]
MPSVKKIEGKINIRGSLREKEPMAAHTTFRVGGPADLFAEPADADDLATLFAVCRDEGIPAFVLGGGANILVSDRGIRGMVIDMSRFNALSIDGETLTVGAGLPVSDAAAWCADRGYAGIHFLYAMPGSVGGAVWMNARCYDGEVFDVLDWVDLLSRDGTERRYVPVADDFAYKVSPFQSDDAVILRCGIRLTAQEPDSVWEQMRSYQADRESKGHFAAPSAGSMFKNDRAFGAPSGVIIDRLGLRGFRVGGAQVSPRHANIIINAGTATATDIDQLATHVEEAVFTAFGFRLEREVLRVGDWTDAASSETG